MRSNVLTIIKKELLRVFTDRRLVFTSFILPALSIALMYSLMGSMVGNMISDQEEHVSKVVMINAPEGFVSLSQETIGSIAIDPSGKIGDLEQWKQKIHQGNIDLVVEFPEGFVGQVKGYDGKSEHPNVNTYGNSGEDYSRKARYDINGALEEYETALLADRVGSEKLVNVFDINKENQESDIVDEKKSTGKGLGNLLPMLISIFLFSGAMGIGMDSIAGEKERGTMATLLVTPVKREEIALGKIMSLGIVALISATSSFIGILISLPFSSRMFGSSEAIDLTSLQFGFNEFAMLGMIMVTLVSLYVGLIVLVSVISKSVKEAGTYVSPVYIVVVIAGVLNMFTTGSPETWQYMVPVYGSIVALKSVFTFELTMPLLMLTCGSSIIVTGILIYVIQKMFNSERVMFSS